MRRTLTIRIPTRRLTAGLAVLLIGALVPTALAVGGTFTDDDTSIFEADIEWLAEAGVTKGCNPSEGNTRFCPEDEVTRGQMAAFMRRFAQFLGAEDGVVSEADHATTAESATFARRAGDAQTLDGSDSDAFVRHGAIIITHVGSEWKPYGGVGGAPAFDTYEHYTLAGGWGSMVMPLPAPTDIAGTAYILGQIEICYKPFGGALIDLISITASDGTDGSSTLYSDSTWREEEDCEVIPLGSEAPRGAAVRVRIADPGGGDDIVLGTVRSTWTAAL